MLIELPGMVTVFERIFKLEYSESYTCNMHGDSRLKGYHYCMCHLVQHLKHSWLWTMPQLIHFNGGNYWCCYLQHWGWGGGGYKVFDSHARDMCGNIHGKGICVLLEIPSMHKLVQYFQSLYGKEDIYNLKGVHIANFEVDLLSTSVE